MTMHETRLHLKGDENSTLNYVTVWFRDDGRVEIESEHDHSAQDPESIRLNDSMTLDEFEQRLMLNT